MKWKEPINGASWNIVLNHGEKGLITEFVQEWTGATARMQFFQQMVRAIINL